MPYKKNTFNSALSYEGQVLRNYKNKIDIHNKLLNTIKSVLPERLSNHALYCTASKNKISIYTDSSVWSSQIRFYHRTMLDALITSNQGVFETLQIKIIPQMMDQENRETVKLPSMPTIDNILQLAENQTDEKLKNALLKLAKTFKKLST